MKKTESKKSTKEQEAQKKAELLQMRYICMNPKKLAELLLNNGIKIK